MTRRCARGSVLIIALVLLFVVTAVALGIARGGQHGQRSLTTARSSQMAEQGVVSALNEGVGWVRSLRFSVREGDSCYSDAISTEFGAPACPAAVARYLLPASYTGADAPVRGARTYAGFAGAASGFSMLASKPRWYLVAECSYGSTSGGGRCDHDQGEYRIKVFATSPGAISGQNVYMEEIAHVVR